MCALGACLLENASLRSLSLRGNLIDDVGAAAFATALCGGNCGVMTGSLPDCARAGPEMPRNKQATRIRILAVIMTVRER